MPLLATFGILALVGLAMYGVLYLAARVGGETPPEATGTASYLSTALMIPFFTIALIVAWVQYLAQLVQTW